MPIIIIIVIPELEWIILMFEFFRSAKEKLASNSPINPTINTHWYLAVLTSLRFRLMKRLLIFLITLLLFSPENSIWHIVSASPIHLSKIVLWVTDIYSMIFMLIFLRMIFRILRNARIDSRSFLSSQSRDRKSLASSWASTDLFQICVKPKKYRYKSPPLSYFRT